MNQLSKKYIEKQTVYRVLNLKDKSNEQIIQEIDKELDRLFSLRSQLTDEEYIYQENRIMNIPLEDLNLPTRAYNCLKRAGYNYSSEFVGMTINELSQIEKLGKGLNLSMVITRLEEAGVVIKEEE
ncbi:MAG: hypothetical protein K6E27_14720 [Eubacterium sp.]|nr:hypothetical protein [Eubacterium sp.]